MSTSEFVEALGAVALMGVLVLVVALAQQWLEERATKRSERRTLRSWWQRQG